MDVDLLLQIVFGGLFLLIAVPLIIAVLAGGEPVETPQACVEAMLRLAKIKKGETVIDPGCGDGRFVITAAKQYGARASGYEIFLFAYLAARIRNLLHGSPASIYYRDGRKADYTTADVVVCYLRPETLKKWKLIWETQMRPGSRIVSYTFEIEGWKPTQMIPRDREKNHGPIWVYVVPKK